MPKLTSSLTNKFVTRSVELEKTRSRMEGRLATGHIELSDIHLVYAGLYLDIFTEFESMIEDLFIGLLSGQLHSKCYNIKRRVKMQPSSMVQEVLFAGKSYLDWLPYKARTVNRASIFFDNGKPFTLLLEQQIANLDNYHAIRNALAHRSASAINKFENVISGMTLLPQEKSPPGYLRSKPYASSTQTQYEIATIELVSIARRLCA